MLDGRRVSGGRTLRKKKMFENGIVPWDMQVLSGTRLQHVLVHQFGQEEVSACNDSLHKASVCLSVCLSVCAT
jgi:hypothetical protein